MTNSDRPTPLGGRPGPTVSVVIPAYGVNRYIAQAVESVLAQTYADCEVIVVNDGAPPAETAELKRILARYPERVRYMEQENGGQAAARNTAMRATTAPYVAFLDGDDYWHPTLLEREMAVLAADPGLALVYCDARLFGEGPFVGLTYMESGEGSEGPVTLESLLARQVHVTMSTIVARRDAVIAAGWFDESLRYIEDYELWLRMAYHGARMAYLCEPLAYRRLRGESLSSNSLKMERGVVHVLEQFGRAHQLSPRQRAAWQDALVTARSRVALTEAKLSLSDGRTASAAEALRHVRPDHASWKLRAAQVALTAVPSVMGVTYRCWTWLLDARTRRASVRAARRAHRVGPPPQRS